MHQGFIGESTGSELVKKLQEYELQEYRKTYKFGILLAKKGQETEEEMFSNGAHTATQQLLLIYFPF